MMPSTQVAAAVSALALSILAAGCGDEDSTMSGDNSSKQASEPTAWTPGPDLDANGLGVDGPQYQDIASLLAYGKTAIVGTFQPESDDMSSKTLMKWDEPVSGMDVVVWTVHVDQTLAGNVPAETIDVILAGDASDLGAEPGDRAVLFIDTIRTPAGQKWNVAGVNQGIIALDDQDQLTASVDATPSLKRQIESVKDLDGLREELQQRT